MYIHDVIIMCDVYTCMCTYRVLRVVAEREAVVNIRFHFLRSSRQESHVRHAGS